MKNMSKMIIKNEETTYQILLVYFDRKKIRLVALDKSMEANSELEVRRLLHFGENQVVTDDYVSCHIDEICEPSIRRINIIDINEKDNSFTTEDGSVYNFYIYDMEESAKRYLLNCIVNYFRCLKQIKSNDFGTLVLKVKG